MVLTVAQCRAARALLDWTSADLCAAAGIGIATVKRFEGGQAINAASLNTIVAAFTAAGITFIAAGESSPAGGEGARLAPRSPGTS